MKKKTSYRFLAKLGHYEFTLPNGVVHKIWGIKDPAKLAKAVDAGWELSEFAKSLLNEYLQEKE